MRSPLFAALCLLASTAYANSLSGPVIYVANASSFVVRDAHRRLQLIRLSGIRAPGRSHPFYENGKTAARELILQKTVSVEWDQRDAYCRNDPKVKKCPFVGKALIEGKDIALELVSLGLARSSDDRREELCTSDRTLYTEAQTQARKKKLGMWATEPKSLSQRPLSTPPKTK